MSVIIHTTQDGCVIKFHLRRTARKNIIVRVASASMLIVNIPPFISLKQLQKWFGANEAALKRLWQQSESIKTELPNTIWYRGQRFSYTFAKGLSAVQWYQQQGFLLPETSEASALDILRTWLRQCARTELISRLQYWALVMQQQPASMALTQARTFWGVCRRRTGIRLNWRLIGAPAFVVDYVCIHELCHLRYANHGRDFWAMVAKYTSKTHDARLWLKQHGSELFALDNVR
ncbi:M48 family metallopeptidase [Snodgrassella alvi]|uniref:M48 family metallopeptidase n=1 Tax=Snodgrassella alvi TaxID=1196083 RepID=UPI003514FC22